MPTLTLVITCLAAFGFISPDAKPAATPKPASLSGTVVNADGKPVPDVDLLLIDQPPNGRAQPVRPSVLRGRTRTEDDGTYQLKLANVPATDGDRLILWAFHRGSRVVSKAISRPATTSGEAIKLALEPESKSAFLIVGPDDKPIVNARVFPTQLNRDGLSVPDALQDFTGVSTDGKGHATITAFRPEELRTFLVSSTDFGPQQWSAEALGPRGDVRTIRLLPPGKVAGQVIDANGRGVGGMRLFISTDPEFIDGDRYTGGAVGIVEASTDANGGFEVPALAEGKLKVSIKSSRIRSDVVEVPIKDERVWPGKTTSVTIHIDTKRATGSKPVTK